MQIAPLTATSVVTSAIERTKAAPPITASGLVAETPKKNITEQRTQGAEGSSARSYTQGGDQQGSRGEQTGHLNR